MSRITIVDLEVFYCVGVTDEERAKPQRLLLTVSMEFDFSSAAVSDRIEKTINYQEVADDLLKMGEGRSWKLLEKLASNIADSVLAKYKPQAVMVEVKKFTVPKAKHVSVSLTRTRGQR
jgi:FolB domain-containing protein